LSWICNKFIPEPEEGKKQKIKSLEKGPFVKIYKTGREQTLQQTSTWDSFFKGDR
jgi:hypothetical protein